MEDERVTGSITWSARLNMANHLENYMEIRLLGRLGFIGIWGPEWKKQRNMMMENPNSKKMKCVMEAGVERVMLGFRVA